MTFSANVPVRVLLVDDHTLFRESLKRVLEAETRFQVVAEASTPLEAIDYCKSGGVFDLGLIDFQLSASDPTQNGLSVLRAVRETQPTAGVILLTAGASRTELREAIQSLSASVFLKSEPTSELFLAIEKTLAGRPWISTGASQILLEDQTEVTNRATDEIAFTTRELSVLRWITEGLSNKQIAGELQISESAVKALLQRLFEKTSVRTRSQLVRYVFECGLVLP
jgi:DNA-binding NarL/FixJ family response regulator